ncbi:MAG: choice-of-anchor L domain-containing protein [Paracoccaceae bacterium]
MPTASELPIDTDASAEDMVNAIFGEGVTIVSASYTGVSHASGIYTDGDTIAPGVTPADTGVILSTGKAESITNSSGDVNENSGTSTDNETADDSDLNSLADAETYDAAVLEATFVPDGTVLTMQITFSSEEYLEYVGSGYNDAVGIFVNGEKAELTIGDGDVTINNINDGSNENLYLDNPADNEAYNTEMDGLTVTLTLKAPVVPDAENTIKIAIADGGDSVYDSNLLIAGNSVQCALVAEDDEVTINGSAEYDVDIVGNDNSSTGSTLQVTEINGIPVVIGDSVTLPSGETVTLNANGTLSFFGDGDAETNTLSYTVQDEDGNTDVGYIELTTVPCFTAGTLITTPRGLIAVEDLRPGDRIMTRDTGMQTLRWIGTATFSAIGAHAPIRLEAGALGNHDTTEVSPNHRILVTTPWAETLFGSSEVLVRAKHLVNGTTIKPRADGRAVIYVHLLFDHHQIVCCDGMLSESYQPGAKTLGSFDAETRAEIFDLIPELDEADYPSARPSLRGYEARLLAPLMH